jgi:hypothetical protein
MLQAYSGTHVNYNCITDVIKVAFNSVFAVCSDWITCTVLYNHGVKRRVLAYGGRKWGYTNCLHLPALSVLVQHYSFSVQSLLQIAD